MRHYRDTVGERTRLHAIARGRVQGIGYRGFVRETASSLNLTGWVRNLFNGDVEMEAEGRKEDLERFIAAVKHGHPWANVEELRVDWLPAGGKHDKEFEVRH